MAAITHVVGQPHEHHGNQRRQPCQTRTKHPNVPAVEGRITSTAWHSKPLHKANVAATQPPAATTLATSGGQDQCSSQLRIFQCWTLVNVQPGQSRSRALVCNCAACHGHAASSWPSTTTWQREPVLDCPTADWLSTHPRRPRWPSWLGLRPWQQAAAFLCRQALLDAHGPHDRRPDHMGSS